MMEQKMDRINLNPSTLLAPVPVVLVSCRGRSGETAKDNLITLAWAGVVCSEPPMVSVAIRKSRFSHRQISETGEFVVNLVNEKLLLATDFCGVKSGRDIDKFAACQLTPIAAPGMELAPALAESPLSMSCKVRQVLELGSHDCFLAEVVAVTASPELIDSDNKLRLDQTKLVAYNHGEYVAMGQLLGFYGFSVASPEVLARRMPRRRAQEEQPAVPGNRPRGRKPDANKQANKKGRL
jgi:flavin reductase (DIM6/NTAB) family NADH-FMN oxidoreductase RutF